MKKLNIHISLLFAILATIFICLTAIGPQANIFGHQEYVFFNGGNDLFADYFNVHRFIAERDPYFNEMVSNYLPLSYLLLMPLNNLCDYAHMSQDDCYTCYVAVISAVVFLIVSLFFFFDSLNRLNKKQGWRTFNTFLLLFSSIFLYSIERGNMVFLAAAGINYFLAYYESESVWKRRFGLFCLCFAAVLKIFPVLFGILLLKDKRYRDIAFCIVVGLLLTFLPFLYFKHGFGNIPRMIEEVRAHMAIAALPDTVYKFGIHSLAQLVMFAVNYINPGHIAAPTIAAWTISTKVLTAILACVSLVFAFMEKQRWMQIGLIAMVIMLYPADSYFYSGLYLIPMIMLFLNKEECYKMDYAVAVLLCLIMNPVQLVYGPVSLSALIINIFSIILWIMLIIYAGIDIFRKPKHIEVQ